jgi:hypothetical protein
VVLDRRCKTELELGKYPSKLIPPIPIELN